MTELHKLIDSFPGQVGLWVENLNTGDKFSHQPERPFYAASTIKLPMLIAVLDFLSPPAKGAAAKEPECLESSLIAALSRPISIKPELVATGSGILKDLSTPLSLPLIDLLTLMIAVSDNTATNVILDHFGHKEPFNAYYQNQGWNQTRSAGMLSLPTGRTDPRRIQGEITSVSAGNLANLLKRLWSGELLSKEATKIALGILSRQQQTGFLRYLPVDLDHIEDKETDLRIFSKSGEIRRSRHEAGILSKGDNAATVVVLTESEADLRFHPDHPAVVLIGHTAERVFHSWLS